MGIRIQPSEIDVPEDDPFKNDLLSRQEPTEVLTHLVGALEGPCVLAVDAAWGAGLSRNAACADVTANSPAKARPNSAIFFLIRSFLYRFWPNTRSSSSRRCAAC